MKSFRATLESGPWNLNWTVIRIPFDAAKVWGSRGQIKVRGEINGVPFQTSLFPDGQGEHILVVNRNMQRAAKAKAGDSARFDLELDTSERVALLPPELECILNEDRALRRWYDNLGHFTRNEIGKWIVDVKSDAARIRRAEQTAERLLSAMDAEHELPPALKAAFRADAAAYGVWEKMAPSHRRAHLLAVFYYRDPQARARRIGKMLGELREKAKRS